MLLRPCAVPLCRCGALLLLQPGASRLLSQLDVLDSRAGLDQVCMQQRQQQQRQQQQRQQQQQQKQKRYLPTLLQVLTDGAQPRCTAPPQRALVCVHLSLDSMISATHRSDEKDWPLLHTSTAALKELALLLDLAPKAGCTADQRAADRLARRLLHDDLRDSGLLPVLGRLIRAYNAKWVVDAAGGCLLG